MISEAKMKIVINNYFKDECDVNTSIREAFEKGFRIGVKKGEALTQKEKPMDLIDRKRALEEMTFSGGIEQDGVLYVPLRDVNNHLKNLPSVQLDGESEITACGDCKH